MEKDEYNQRIQDAKESIKGLGFQDFKEKFKFLKGMPFHPTNAAFRCMGIWPSNPSLEILNGFIRMGWDFNVGEADGKCLFTVFEDEQRRFSRWEKEIGERINKLSKSVGTSFLDKTIEKA